MSRSSEYAWLFACPQDDKCGYIRRTLELAADLRADVHMDFFANQRFLFQMRGACVAVKPDSLRIYLRGGVEQLPAKSLRVHAYFILHVEQRELPCDFEADILDAAWEGKDPYLSLAMPGAMGHNQRRCNVRIPVCWQDVPGLRLWRAKKESGDVKDWEPLPLEELELRDISAGGVQVSLASKSPLLPDLLHSEIMLTDGDFAIRGKSAPALNITGAIVRKSGEPAEPKTVLGIRFQSWAQTRGEALVWRSLRAEEGIPPLGAWVFQVILERSRGAK